MATAQAQRDASRRLARKRQAYIHARRDELGPCWHCGSTDRLEFDHVDPSTKRRDVCRMLTYSIKAIEEEIAKCQVLCKPCHVAKGQANGEQINATTFKTKGRHDV